LSISFPISTITPKHVKIKLFFSFQISAIKKFSLPWLQGRRATGSPPAGGGTLTCWLFSSAKSRPNCCWSRPCRRGAGCCRGGRIRSYRGWTTSSQPAAAATPQISRLCLRTKETTKSLKLSQKYINRQKKAHTNLHNMIQKNKMPKHTQIPISNNRSL